MNNKATLRNFHIFLSFLIISLVGNAIADFALLWFAVNKLGQSDNAGMVTSIYSGQAIGYVVLAPIVAQLFDKLPRRFGGAILDLAYILILAIIIWAYRFNYLNVYSIFIFSTLIAAISSIHKGAIGFGALKTMSSEIGLEHLVVKYNGALYLTNLIGILVSGFFFSKLGLGGCMILAIITFLPMPFVYLLIFNKKFDPAVPATKSGIRNIIAGWDLIFKSKILFGVSAVAATVNFVSNIFPALVVISFVKHGSNETFSASIAIAISIFLGLVAYSFSGRLVKKFKLNRIPIVSFFLTNISLVVAFFIPGPLTISVAFAMQCMGAALLNTMTGIFRVHLVPAHLIGQVNTSFFAIVFSSQLIGSLTIIPTMNQYPQLGIVCIFLIFIFASFLGLVLLPNKLYEEVKAQ